MLPHNFRVLSMLLTAGHVSALPFSPSNVGRRGPVPVANVAVVPVNHVVREHLANSTSSRTSTTVFFNPHASTTPIEHSSAASPLSGSSASSAHGISTVTIPWSPTATSSQSVHIITITSPWPSITPTVTVTGPLSSTTSEVSAQLTPTTPLVAPTPTIVTVTIPTEEPAPAVVTVTSPPQQPVPGVVTVIDTTVTVYISSGVLTVLPTVTVTASTPKAPDVVTITVG
ncbi:hypothetical protein CONLIGDRAFT_684615 [Coniochaeta ligniaria NRRL 30616]|uniref:REJ domain-containing protein n=1 Tax=Coniochaeta ligniaria NRRL 30616 TaxID=1408157 RepID=A0A1J7IF48_9PEZI|nr:hypothetical protein CONLIGDRAFT_684615 [Coniochaeta ligniaria NRRL 30616]